MYHHVVSGWMTVIFACCALFLVALGVGSEHWIDIEVDRDALKQFGATGSDMNIPLYMDPSYYSRHRGLFYTCYKGKDVVFILEGHDDLIHGNCLKEKGYEMTRQSHTKNWGDDYEDRIYLMRCHFAFLIVAIILLVLGLLAASWTCIWPSWLSCTLAGVFFIFAVVSGVIAMVCFHVFEDLELEQINQPGFPKYWRRDQLLDQHATYAYGYSYIVSWIGLVCALLATIFAFWCAFVLRDIRYMEKVKHRRRRRRHEPVIVDQPFATPAIHAAPVLPQATPVYVLPQAAYPSALQAPQQIYGGHLQVPGWGDSYWKQPNTTTLKALPHATSFYSTSDAGR